MLALNNLQYSTVQLNVLFLYSMREVRLIIERKRLICRYFIQDRRSHRNLEFTNWTNIQRCLMSERLYLKSYKRSDKRNISSQSLKLNKSLNNSKSLKLERLKHKQFLEIKQINLITKKHFKISITELLSQSSPRDWISLDNWINFVILIRWRISGRAGRCRQLEQRNVDISV